jgi:hypothetical protein
MISRERLVWMRSNDTDRPPAEGLMGHHQDAMFGRELDQFGLWEEPSSPECHSLSQPGCHANHKLGPASLRMELDLVNCGNNLCNLEDPLRLEDVEV